jgi:hypothetical protein
MAESESSCLRIKSSVLESRKLNRWKGSSCFDGYRLGINGSHDGREEDLLESLLVGDSVHLSTLDYMSTFTPSPEFDYYYKACRKGDPGIKPVTVNQSPVAVLADGTAMACSRGLMTSVAIV